MVWNLTHNVLFHGTVATGVDECIAAYVQLMKKIEKPSKRNLVTSPFSMIRLSVAVGYLSAASHRKPRKLCTFAATRCLAKMRFLPPSVSQAAHATSAATTFFKPVSIGARRFADGVLGANNPADEVEREAYGD
ncbi:uncharacterized protein ASPGLDRAFT_26004 [Aspergillus glaucus CBS 516.65]|uniref:PNPLA domain-containing protein n=1 Tax=Aspergillus glaucus CBS 516.65 TaxID=1160497 RepID=A0A1L9VIV8_ASPGL|nr:hypothetical protein ASPGLDRAFT_26004 [Aspergillus glaucus CBS 516.65]OJJ83805.1 hypothetical protein ASPGLDRAFT_26004 [Aspergillus glaucus CBS 516.65]